MVAGGDAEASEKVVDDCPDSSLPLERCEGCSDTSSERDTANKCDVEPVDVFVPVAPGHGSIRNVRLVRIVFWVSVWLRFGSHWRWLLVFGDEGRIHCHHASDRLVARHYCCTVSKGVDTASGSCVMKMCRAKLRKEK